MASSPPESFRARASARSHPGSLNRPVLSWALAADSTREPTGDGQGAVDHLDRYHGETPGRGPIDDPGAIPGIKLGTVAGTEEGFRLRSPHRDRAPLVRADPRVRHDAVCRERSSFLTELCGIEADEQYQIQGRPVSHDLCARIHRVGLLLGPAERQVLRHDDLSLLISE